MYASKCEGTGKLYPSREILEVHFADGTCKRLSSPFVRKAIGNLMVSDLTSRLYPETEKVYIYEGLRSQYVAAKPELKYHAFQCDGCDQYWLLQYRYQPTDGDHLLCPACFPKFVKTQKLTLSARTRQHVLPLIAAE